MIALKTEGFFLTARLVYKPWCERRGLLAVFATGVALNLWQPENALFYITLLPNAVGSSLTPGHIAALTAVIVAVEAVVIGGHVILAGRARSLLRTPTIVRRVDRTAGAVMVGAGVAVAAAR